MDTTTYASVVALIWSAVQTSKPSVVTETEFISLNLSYIGPIGSNSAR
jgi:hypothetical protein